MELDARIEAVLFHKSEPVSISKLAEVFGVSEDTITAALETLKTKLTGRGIELVRIENEVVLTTSPEAGELIEQLVKEELSRDLGKAGAETLAIVIYQGPVSRSRIDYIRGVNSSAILRNLLVRGLVERITNPDDSRSFLYKPSFELLQHLGLSSLEELPDYTVTRTQLENFTLPQSND